jgi:hypothetical protein
VYVTATNEEDLSGSKGTCNFQVKWERSAKSSAHLNVQETVKGVKPRVITGQEQMRPSYEVAQSCTLQRDA